MRLTAYALHDIIMDNWTIIDTHEYREWWVTLSEPIQEDIAAALSVLRQLGPALGRPYVDSLKGCKYKNMKELRVQSFGQPLRILFAFDPWRRAVLLVGGNKRGDKNFYIRMIRLAEKIFSRYLKRYEEEQTKR